MKKIVFVFALFISGFSVNVFSEETFTVLLVGSSNNTKSVFVDVLETPINSTCENKKHFKLLMTDEMADYFYSAAMSATVAGLKMKIHYEAGECYQSGNIPRYFKLVK